LSELTQFQPKNRHFSQFWRFQLFFQAIIAAQRLFLPFY